MNYSLLKETIFLYFKGMHLLSLHIRRKLVYKLSILFKEIPRKVPKLKITKINNSCLHKRIFELSGSLLFIYNKNLN